MSFLSRLFSGFKEERRAPQGDPLRVAEVESVLLELRPMFAADGGDITVDAIDEDGSVHLRLEGACSSCGVREMTIHDGIEPRLRERCPWVSRVHAA